MLEIYFNYFILICNCVLVFVKKYLILLMKCFIISEYNMFWFYFWKITIKIKTNYLNCIVSIVKKMLSEPHIKSGSTICSLHIIVPYFKAFVDVFVGVRAPSTDFENLIFAKPFEPSCDQESYASSHSKVFQIFFCSISFIIPAFSKIYFYLFLAVHVRPR